MRGKIVVKALVVVSCAQCGGEAWYPFGSRTEAAEKAQKFRADWVRTPTGWVHRRCFLLQPWREDLRRWMRSHRLALSAGN